MTVIRGGIRYRDRLGEHEADDRREGRLKITFADPGMHWVNATFSEGGSPRREGPPPSAAGQQPGERSAGLPDDAAAKSARAAPREQASRPLSRRSAARRSRGMRGPGADRPIVPGRRASYITTLEVLPQ